MIAGVRKRLTANDLGLTGSHQAGIHVPKHEELLQFFPYLDPERVNPRATVRVSEHESGQGWEFNFIYYNNKRRGGTRDEYRMTGMTGYFRANRISPGDTLEFERRNDGGLSVSVIREDARPESEQPGFTIVLKGEWKLTKIN